MSLFKRSVVAEITSHAGVVFSTLMVVWLSVLLVRLLGEAANGAIGADIVFGLAAFSSITALPVILAVSLFIAVLTTVTRSYRESEMVVWFVSGLSLKDWIAPILRCALPVSLLIALLTLFASPWAYRQIGEYRQRYEQRSDLSKVTAGQFIETQGGDRVFFAEEPSAPGEELGRVIARVIDPEWHSIITAESANIQTEKTVTGFWCSAQVTAMTSSPASQISGCLILTATGSGLKANLTARLWRRFVARPKARQKPGPRGNCWPTTPIVRAHRSCGGWHCLLQRLTLHCWPFRWVP